MTRNHEVGIAMLLLAKRWRDMLVGAGLMISDAERVEKRRAVARTLRAEQLAEQLRAEEAARAANREKVAQKRRQNLERARQIRVDRRLERLREREEEAIADSREASRQRAEQQRKQAAAVDARIRKELCAQRDNLEFSTTIIASGFTFKRSHVFSAPKLRWADLDADTELFDDALVENDVEEQMLHVFDVFTIDVLE